MRAAVVVLMMSSVTCQSIAATSGRYSHRHDEREPNKFLRVVESTCRTSKKMNSRDGTQKKPGIYDSALAYVCSAIKGK